MIDQTSVVPSGAGRTRYTSEAVRTGDVIPAGDAGLKLNELYPQRYPHAAVAVAVSRAQVKAELAEAIRTGDMMATGELGLKLNEEFPQRYPAIVAVASTKTRDQVNAETREAIRNGDMYAAAKACRSSTKSFRIAMPRPARFTPARRRTRRHRPRARSCTDRETGLTRSLNRE